MRILYSITDTNIIYNNDRRRFVSPYYEEEVLTKAFPESVTSLLGVANAGFRLSLLLNAVASQIASSGIEIHSISKGVSLFSLALKHVGRALQATDSVHAPNALDEAKKIADQGFMTLNEIEDMLDQLKASENLTNTHGLSIQQRVKWCFKKHRVTYLLAQLECLKLSLTVMLQVLQLGKLIEAKRLQHQSIFSEL